MARVLGTLVAVLLVLPSAAEAQAPPPETVYAPLLERAEADLEQGRAALARARAEVVIRFVPSGADLSGRAAEVHRSAREAAGDADPPAAEHVWEPLLRAAETDAEEGRSALASARVEAILANVEEGTPVAIRASQLRESLGSDAGTVPPPPGGEGEVPPPPGGEGRQQQPPPPPPSGGLGSPPPTGGGAPPGDSRVPPPPGYGQGTTTTVAPPERPPPPAGPAPDPTLRQGGEMVELYVAGSSFGVFTGVYVLVALGADDEEDDSLFGTLPILFGAGGALGVMALDSGEGLRHGQPGTIAVGSWLGLSEGLLALAAFEDDFDTTRSAFNLVWGSTFVGTGLGVAAAFTLEPTPGEAHFTLASAGWGTWLMGLLAIGAEVDDAETGWGMALGGFNAGMVLGAALAHPLDLNGLRVSLLNVGFVAGIGAGSLIPAFIASARDSELTGQAVGTAMGVGSAAGLVVAFLLTSGRDWEREEEPEGAEGPDVTAFTSPVRGGAVAGFRGTF